MPSRRKVVINWGNSKAPSWENELTMPRILNQIPNVRSASNKLTAFNLLKASEFTATPAFTDTYDTALEWVTSGKVIVCRTQLNGHSGAGIVMAARPEDVVVGCPLFVEYSKKKYEYRVHVAFGKVIDIQQKRKRADYEGTVDYAVRNHHTGWVYCRDGVEAVPARDDLAVQAVKILGLDFGAVDIIYNEYHNTYLVLEVNTAPGLEGATVDKYCNAFTEELTE